MKRGRQRGRETGSQREREGENEEGTRHRCLKNSEINNHAIWAATEYCYPFTWGTRVCLLV